MQLHIPRDVDCVGSDKLGESERAMMHYVLGIETVDPEQCLAFVREGFAREPLGQKAGWELVWWGARPGDTRERFELYVRDDY